MQIAKLVFTSGDSPERVIPESILPLDNATFTSRFHRRAFYRFFVEPSQWPASLASHLLQLTFLGSWLQPTNRLRRKLKPKRR